jgi:hypothetical protein
MASPPKDHFNRSVQSVKGRDAGNKPGPVDPRKPAVDPHVDSYVKDVLRQRRRMANMMSYMKVGDEPLLSPSHRQLKINGTYQEIRHWEAIQKNPQTSDFFKAVATSLVLYLQEELKHEQGPPKPLRLNDMIITAKPPPNPASKAPVRPEKIWQLPGLDENSLRARGKNEHLYYLKKAIAEDTRVEQISELQKDRNEQEQQLRQVVAKAKTPGTNVTNKDIQDAAGALVETAHKIAQLQQEVEEHYNFTSDDAGEIWGVDGTGEALAGALDFVQERNNQEANQKYGEMDREGRKITRDEMGQMLKDGQKLYGGARQGQMMGLNSNPTEAGMKMMNVGNRYARQEIDELLNKIQNDAHGVDNEDIRRAVAAFDMAGMATRQGQMYGRNDEFTTGAAKLREAAKGRGVDMDAAMGKMREQERMKRRILEDSDK